jgi:Pectate lyase superfamily protein
MTVSSTTSRITYAGDGSSTSFAVPFGFYNSTDLLVEKQDASGNVTTWVLGTNYTVAGGAGTTGTVTATVAPASGETLAILLAPVQTQLSHYVQGQPFPSADVEENFDRLTQMSLRQNDQLARTLHGPDTDLSAWPAIPGAAARANTVLTFDSSGNPLPVPTSTLINVSAYGTANGDKFTATAGQTVFTLSGNPGSINNLDVSLDGATLVPVSDYTWTAPYTLTLTTGAKVGQTLYVRYLQALPQGSFSAAGSNGQIIYNNNGTASGFTMTGDVTVVPTTGVATGYYTQGSTGSVTRTMKSKFQESISVKDFGADPTGATDSTTAFNNALSATAGSVIVPDGTYLISNVKIPSGKVLVGSSSRNVQLLQKAASTGACVSIDSTSQASGIFGISINGNASNQSSSNHGFAINNVGSAPSGTNYPGANLILNDVYVFNAKGDGFNLNAPSGSGVSDFRNLRAWSNGGRGMYVNTQDASFTNLDLGVSGSNGLYLDSSCANNHFVSLKVWWTAAETIYLNGAFQNQFTGLQVQDAGTHGISLQNAANGNTFSSVSVDSIGRTTASSYAFVLSASLYNDIRGNVSNGFSYTGMAGCGYLAGGGSIYTYNNHIEITTQTSTLTTFVFNDSVQPWRNHVLVTNRTNNNGENLLTNLQMSQTLNVIGTSAQMVVDTGASVTTNLWAAKPNGNDAVAIGYPNSRMLNFSKNHANAGWTVINYGDGTTGAHFRVQNYNGTTFATAFEAIESGGANQIGLYGVTPVLRATTSGSSATFTANSGTAVNNASTFNGYTIAQVVQALQNIGVLT